jgi:predicted ArsR family transcriptional regulator
LTIEAADQPSLPALVGVTRAQVLIALQSPRTTGDVAARVRIAASAAAEHLTALVRAGAVEREQASRAVYYRRTQAGETLVQLFSCTA